MSIVASYIVEIIVLAGHPHAFLRVDRSAIGTFVGANEYVLELDHARVGEQKCTIPARDKRHRRHGSMPVLHEEVYEGLANFIACQFLSHSDLR
jgi:hypothetical protein